MKNGGKRPKHTALKLTARLLVINSKSGANPGLTDTPLSGVTVSVAFSSAPFFGEKILLLVFVGFLVNFMVQKVNKINIKPIKF